MSDALTQAVEAGELAIRQQMRAGVADGVYVRAPTYPEVLAGLKAARPLLPEARAVERVRALCEEASRRGAPKHQWVTTESILRALEGDTPNDDERGQ